MTQKNKFTPYIWIISIVIPVVVAILFTVRIPNVASLSFLPPIYATVNGITSVILLLALNAIKNKNIKLHENLMKTAIALSLAFLLMYVAYHMTSDSTPYGGEGFIRYGYFFILISHIILGLLDHCFLIGAGVNHAWRRAENIPLEVQLISINVDLFVLFIV